MSSGDPIGQDGGDLPRSGPLVTLVFLVVALVGSLAVILGPRFGPPPAATPLATGAQPDPGEAGGLVPDARVIVRGVERSVRDIRPAVLVIIPDDCTCEHALNTIFAQAVSYRLGVYLVGPAQQSGVLDELAGRAGNGTVGVVVDRDAALSVAYLPRGLTLVLVHTDGVVADVVRGVAPGARLESALAVLSRPGDE